MHLNYFADFRPLSMVGTYICTHPLLHGWSLLVKELFRVELEQKRNKLNS